MASSSTQPSYWDRHCDTETRTPVVGQVVGELPDWLRGRLIRNGPGVRHFGGHKLNHLFDGMALLHMVNIEDGKAYYTSRFLESDSYSLNSRAQRVVVSEFGTAAMPDPCVSLFGRFASLFQNLQSQPVTDNCSVNVLQVKDELLAMTETSIVRVVDPLNLDTLEKKYQYSHYCSVNMATAHPHVDADGTVFNTGLRVKGGPPSYAILAMKDGDISSAKVVASAPCRWKFNPGYMHSFGLTENYFILIESPLAMDVSRLFLPSFLGAKTFCEGLKFHKGTRTRFRVICRKTGKELKTEYSAEDFFGFHFINCFESNGCIMVDICATEDYGIIDKLWMSNLMGDNDNTRKLSMTTPRRYVLPVGDVDEADAGKNLLENVPEARIVRDGYSSSSTAIKCKDGKVEVTGATFANMMMELPRINYNYNTKPYKFSYSIYVKDGGKQSVSADGFTKLDMMTGEYKVWEDENHYSSEPVFVEHPEAETEDDGVVISILLNKEDPRKLAFVVIDAKFFVEVARVNFTADGVVTPTFHGQFVSASEDQHAY